MRISSGSGDIRWTACTLTASAIDAALMFVFELKHSSCSRSIKRELCTLCNSMLLRTSR
jgi:hypothetical protein